MSLDDGHCVAKSRMTFPAKTFLFCSFFFLSGLLSLHGETTNTSSLSCWEGHNRSNFQSRKAKTAVFQSSAGFAYAEVQAEASTDAVGAEFCKNMAQLFYSRDGKDYKSVYAKAGLEDQGVGMRVIGWSSSGTNLLIELSVWGYDRDTEVVKSALMLDAGAGQVRELPLDDAFEHILGKDCEFDSSLVGWQTDDNILVRVTKTPPTNRYEQTFCVDKPTVYSFSLKNGTMQRSGR